MTGTLATAAQPNVTSLGTLSSLSVSGNANVGNIGATNLVGTLTTASQTNITAVGTLASLSVTANANIGNIGTAGSITSTGNVIAGNVYANSGIGGFTTLSASGNVNGANINATTYSVTGVTTGISASGSVQGDATALTTAINIVGTVSAGQGVRLPTAVAGMVVYVTNDSATTLNVYPASSASINAASTNVAYSLPTKATVQFVAATTSRWLTVTGTYA